MKRLKYLVQRRTVRAIEGGTYIGLENIESGTGRRIETESTSDGENLAFHSGDVLFGKLRPYLAKVFLAEFNGVCTSEFLVLRPTVEITSRFLFYYVLSPKFIDAVTSFSSGAKMPRAEWDVIGSLELDSPPVTQQCAIADFLDRETAKIDDLTATKQCLLDRLEEYRFALIARSVSQGLPNINVTWKQARLGRVFRLQRGFDITEASHGSGSVPVISSGGFSGVTESPMVKGPGVVVGRKGTLGTVHYVERDYWPHDTTLFVQDFRGSVPRFVYYFLRYLRLESYDVGAANPTLNRNHVHPLPVRWPDYQSQRAIADHLDQAMPQIDAAAQTVKAAIALLREYRSSLISAAVTGQLDIHRHQKQPNALA
jgi:type I restriction enzyme, S subunit